MGQVVHVVGNLRGCSSVAASQWGCYIVVDRAQDMFFVLMQNSPSERQHIQINVKKIIYDAFEK